MLTTKEKEDITAGFTAATDRINDVEETSKQAFLELSEAVNELRKGLKAYNKSILNASMDAGDYLGFWKSEEHAKMFGYMVMAATRKGTLSEDAKKALSEAVNVEGGILVPEEMSNRLIQKLGIYGKFRKNALVVPVGGDRQIVPKVESDLTIYAPGEGETITDSDMTFSQVGLNIIKFCCLCKVSAELEEDSVMAIGEIIGMSMARSMAKKEDLIGFLGDGTETYYGMRGIVGALRAVSDTISEIKGLKVGSGNAYSELTLDDFEGTVAILPDDVDEGAKWYASRKIYFNVMYKLARAAGAADLFAILTDRKERFFMGYPIEFVSCMPSTEANSQICALLGDLKAGAFLGERKQLSIDTSRDVYFANHQLGIRGIERIAINAYGVGDTTEAGQIVGLIMAAS